MKFYPPGTRIAGRYEIASHPLMGGMGIVYLCFDHEEDRPVALKTFKPEFLPDRAARDRFLREGTTWVNLGRYPHIVRAYGVERIGDGREVYLVLELVAKEEGRTDASLRSWLVAGRPLPVEQALLFGLQIARGMAHATAISPGFVHRDLKPENVLVGRDKLLSTGVNRLRVTDFGLAAVLETSGAGQRTAEGNEPESSARLERTQLTRGIVGTPLYMAPEQWKGESVTVQTDMYALGCILYEMLAGQRAVEGHNLAALEQAHCAGEVRPLPGGLPQSVREVIARCLALEPGARYGSWGEVGKALEGAYVEVTGQSTPEPEPLQARDRAERVAVGWSYSEIGASYLDIGKAEVALTYFQRVWEVGGTEGERRLEGAGLTHLGLTYFVLGDARRAIRFFEQALAIDREIGDLHGEGADLDNLGCAYRNLGEVRRAIGFFEQALAIDREIGNLHGEGAALGNLGNAYLQLGDARQAIGFYQQQLVITREIGDRGGEGNALGSLGLAYARLGEIKRAIGFYEQRLEIAREIGDRQGEGTALGNLGSAYADLGDARRAIEFYKQRLEIAREIGDRRGEGSALGNLGATYFQLGDVRQAIRFSEQALAIDREIGDRHGEGAGLGNLGNAYLQLGDVRQAIGFHEQALAIYREIGDRRGEANAMGNLGLAYADLGDAQRAIGYYEQALVIAREIGDRRGEGKDLGNLGNAQRAIEYWQQAKTILEQVGDIINAAGIGLNLALLLIQQGHFAKALPHAEQAAQVSTQIGHAQHAQRAQQLIAQIRAALR